MSGTALAALIPAVTALVVAVGGVIAALRKSNNALQSSADAHARLDSINAPPPEATTK